MKMSSASWFLASLTGLGVLASGFAHADIIRVHHGNLENVSISHGCLPGPRADLFCPAVNLELKVSGKLYRYPIRNDAAERTHFDDCGKATAHSAESPLPNRAAKWAFVLDSVKNRDKFPAGDLADLRGVAWVQKVVQALVSPRQTQNGYVLLEDLNAISIQAE